MSGCTSGSLQTQVVLDPNLPEGAQNACEEARNMKARKETETFGYRLAVTQCQKEQKIAEVINKVADVPLRADENRSTRTEEAEKMTEIVRSANLRERTWLPIKNIMLENAKARESIRLKREDEQSVAQKMSQIVLYLREEIQPSMVQLCQNHKASEDCLP